MLAYRGENLERLYTCFRSNGIPEELIERFKDHLIINHQGIDGYVATKENYGSVWNEIDAILNGQTVEQLSESVGIRWAPSPDLD